MRAKLNDEMLENVNGGTVIISSDCNNVGFSTLREKYDLKCSWKDARDLLDEELDKNLGLNNYEFDLHMKKLYQDRGWI